MPALPEPGRRLPGPNQLIPAHVGEGRFLCLLHASGHTLTLTHPRYTQLHSPLAHHPALLLPAQPSPLLLSSLRDQDPKVSPSNSLCTSLPLQKTQEMSCSLVLGGWSSALLKGRGRQGCKNQERTALLGEDVLLHQLCWAAGDTTQGKKNTTVVQNWISCS